MKRSAGSLCERLQSAVICSAAVDQQEWLTRPLVTQQILVPSVDAVDDRRGRAPAGEGFVGLLMG